MIAKKQGNKIEISFKYDPGLVMLVKSFSGRSYNPKSKSWFIPLAGCLPAIEKLRKVGFKIDEEIIIFAEHDKKQAEEAVALAVMDDAVFETVLPLFPYQKVGASFLYNIGSGLLGDEMGLGKTIQSLAVCEKTKAQKILVFCPASVKWQWHDEIKRFIPGAEVCVIEGDKKARDACWTKEARFYVANYELLLRDAIMQAIEWDIVIADEATKISNPMAKQSKAIKKLRAKRRIAMTGTPVSNRANEVWNLVDFISPGALGDYWGFLQRYCLKNQWGGIFGYQNMDELRDKLKRYMIRRLKKDVLPELPEKIITDIPFEMTEEEKSLYKKIKKEILFEIEKSDISKLEQPMTVSYTLVKMVRLRQLADSLELLGENKKSSKLEVLKDLLINIFEE